MKLLAPFRKTAPLPGHCLAVWVYLMFNCADEAPTFEEILDAHPDHTEESLLPAIHGAVANGFLATAYSPADGDMVYVLGPALRAIGYAS